ncbi:MAG: hypothetical protein AMR96_07190 [Candidatus Adiutrix intracellularis]|nr:MAG: hypothetical protein AMR96_07190 [Candidatus Adiutrix intracellularis]
MDYVVGFLGYGRMAQAISGGFNRAALFPFIRQAAADVDELLLAKTSRERGFTPLASNRELVSCCEIVIIAVKPHQVRSVLEEVREIVRPGQLFISIAAGVSLATLGRELPESVHLVRVMPNLPTQVGYGVTLVCGAPSLAPERLQEVLKIFVSIGLALELPENLFDAATAVSGSGPAYFFLMMEALIRGAVRLGLTWETARTLVIQTAAGSAEMARTFPEFALSELRDQVTSPAGTTVEGLYTLEEGGFTALLQKAVWVAAEKSKNL